MMPSTTWTCLLALLDIAYETVNSGVIVAGDWLCQRTVTEKEELVWTAAAAAAAVVASESTPT
jgi:hypothetical protein